MNRSAKYTVNYQEDSLTSLDESDNDILVKPGMWKRKRAKNLHVPLRGPSQARLAAHKLIQKRKEDTAAEALLNLNPEGLISVTSYNTGSTPDLTSSSSSQLSSNSSEYSSSTQAIDTDSDISNDISKCSQCSTSSDDHDDSDGKSDTNAEETTRASETDEDDKPLAELQKELKKQDSKVKGYFKTTRYELFKYKRSRVFKCLSCDTTKTSQRKINEHYRLKHGNLKCELCDKICLTVSSLRKHMYSHSDKANKHPCADCNKSFPFASELKSHRKTHLEGLEFHCLHCKKSFKNKGELTKHQSVHSGKEWTCEEAGCEYSCNDPRNLRAHMFKHSYKLRYKCTKCAKGFKYYQQLKRHRVTDCT